MKKRLFAAVLCAAVVMSATAPAMATADEKTGDGEVWVADWRDQVFRDEGKPEDVPAAVNLTTARNDTEPFQIQVRPLRDGRINYVAFSDLVSEGHTISVDQISYRYVDYIRSYTNSRYSDGEDSAAVMDEYGTPWVNISNPIRVTSEEMTVAYPEILTKEQGRDVRAGETQAVWGKIHVPAEAPAGMYLGQMQVETTFGSYYFDINLEVKNVLIPDTSSPESFSMEIWSQLIGNFDTEIDVITDAYGVTVDSPEWWNIMGHFADLMKENRLNVLTVNQTALLLAAPGTRVEENGTVIFDWSFHNRFVTFFRERAGIQTFSGGPLAKYKSNPKNYDNNVPGEEPNDYTQSFVECLVPDPEHPGKAKRQLVSVDLEAYGAGTSQPALEYVRQYAASLNQNLTANGWQNIWHHHIIDEPGKRQSAALYPVLEGILSSQCPSIKTGDAFTVWTAVEQAPHTEVFAVMEYSLDELADMMAENLKEGDKLWMYTSLMPIKDNYLNKTIDQPVWFTEMMGWLCYRHGATGYLNWGLNQWNTWTTDYRPYPDYPEAVLWENVLGDASCVYPDKKNMEVRSSIRVEALREASELNSILREAAKRHPQEVNALVDQMVRSGKDYETDLQKIVQARIQLLNLAAQ